MYRTKNCGELTIQNVGEEVTLAGWIQTIRSFGSIIFIDLRDRYGITQLYFNEIEAKKIAEMNLGREYVVQAKGRVIERSNKNPNIATGDIEIDVKEFKVFNAAKTPPFTIESETDGGEDIRMKFRYLDLRRSPLQRNLLLRYQINKETRKYLDALGFVEIETPFLIGSTPEGARDFVVPSRINPHEFYALPQSPQTFKQLLMVSGFDRYFQIVKCFRDEDLRADRQPEFTQLDCELSFIEQEDILQIFEGWVKHLLKQVHLIDYTADFPRLTWSEAMRRFGNDKPDIRFGMELVHLKAPQGAIDIDDAAIDYTHAVDFKVIQDAEAVIGICAKGLSGMTRKEIDEWTNWVKRPQIGMTGLMYVKYNEDGSIKSSVDKFYTEEQLKVWLEMAQAEPGDIFFILAGSNTRTVKAASELRMELARKLGLRRPDVFAPLWVVDFPLLEYIETNEDGGGAGRWIARHHPFTSPKPDQIEWMKDSSKFPYIKANAYDLILNGNEIGGGSIRIFDKELQQNMFRALGISEEEQKEKFGFLLEAFEYGAPPHGGIAFGFDRLTAILGGDEVIRDYIAFPKNTAGRDMMTKAPGAIAQHQLDELNIQLKEIKD